MESPLLAHPRHRRPVLRPLHILEHACQCLVCQPRRPPPLARIHLPRSLTSLPPSCSHHPAFAKKQELQYPAAKLPDPGLHIAAPARHQQIVLHGVQLALDLHPLHVQEPPCERLRASRVHVGYGHALARGAIHLRQCLCVRVSERAIVGGGALVLRAACGAVAVVWMWCAGLRWFATTCLSKPLHAC